MKNNKFVWLVIGIVIGGVAMIMLQVAHVINTPGLDFTKSRAYDDGSEMLIEAESREGVSCWYCEDAYERCRRRYDTTTCANFKAECANRFCRH